MDTTKTRRPFHETIVDAIFRANSGDLQCLATIIKATTIPNGHEEIIKAWNWRRAMMGWGDLSLGVPADLLEQKKEAEEKESAKKE